LASPLWSKIFAGFKSLCIIFNFNKALYPSVIYVNILKAICSETLLLGYVFKNEAKSPLLQYFKIKYKLFVLLVRSTKGATKFDYTCYKIRISFSNSLIYLSLTLGSIVLNCFISITFTAYYYSGFAFKKHL